MSSPTLSSGPKPMTMASLVGLVLLVAVCGVGCDEPYCWALVSDDGWTIEWECTDSCYIGVLGVPICSPSANRWGSGGASARIAAR